MINPGGEIMRYRRTYIYIRTYHVPLHYASKQCTQHIMTNVIIETWIIDTLVRSTHLIIVEVPTTRLLATSG